jgi:cytidyltransferase-like protein
MRVYVDGVWDMFHVGHLKCLEYARAYGEGSGRDCELIVGVVSDEDAASYKRVPLIPHEERCQIVRALRIVTAVIPACPLVVTHTFLEVHGIDKVVHGFANDADRQKQARFFEGLGSAFQEIPYTSGVSTTELMRRITLASN